MSRRPWSWLATPAAGAVLAVPFLVPTGWPAATAAALVLLAPVPALGWFAVGGGWARGAGLAASWFAVAGCWLIALDPVLGPLAWLASVVISAILGVPLGWALGRLRERYGPTGMLAWAPVVWAGWEILRLQTPIGSPWCSLGHAWWAVRPAIQVAELTSYFGLSLLSVIVAAGLARLLLAGPEPRPEDWRQLQLGLLLLIVNLGGGAVRLQQVDPTLGEPLQVALVQGSVPSAEKTSADETFAIHRVLTATAPAETELLIWPETAVAYPVWDDPLMRCSLQQAAKDLQATMLIGAVGREPGDWQGRPIATNIALVIGPDGELVDRYQKVHLVLLGEYMPWRDSKALAWLAAQTPQYFAGRRFRSVATRHGQLGVPICYEATFPAESRAIARDGARALVVLTNDEQMTWLGARQHFQQAVFRCVELRRWMARTANSGITALIDPTGRVVSQTGWMERTVHTGTIWLRDDASGYLRWGDWFGWLCVALTAAACGWPGRWGAGQPPPITPPPAG